jgi:hypothetical protein
VRDVLCCRLVHIERNALALVHHHRAEIVDAVGLVGVLMGQEHSIEMIDGGIDQLLAEIGRSIDHDPGRGVGSPALDQQRTAAAAIFGIVGIASAPAKRRARDAGGRAAAEDGYRQRHAVICQ